MQSLEKLTMGPQKYLAECETPEVGQGAHPLVLILVISKPISIVCKPVDSAED